MQQSPRILNCSTSIYEVSYVRLVYTADILHQSAYTSTSLYMYVTGPRWHDGTKVKLSNN